MLIMVARNETREQHYTGC